MSVDLSKLAFSSDVPIDKIVGTGEVTIVNNGATVNDPQVARIVTGSAVNPYGSRCFVRVRWSIDGGTSWQALDTRITYTYTITAPGPSSATLTGLRAAVSVGVSDALVHFRTANGYHGNVTDDGVSYSYTPTSQTFTIQYVLFEES